MQSTHVPAAEPSVAVFLAVLAVVSPVAAVTAIGTGTSSPGSPVHADSLPDGARTSADHGSADTPGDLGSARATVQQPDPDSPDELTGYVVSNVSRASEPGEPNVTNPPIADARVTIQELDRTVRSDLFGFFSFEDLDPGTYTLAVSAEGYDGVEREVTVEGRTHSVVELNRTERLYAMDFSVEAKDTSIDLRNASVTVDGRTKSPNANGSVRFDHLSAGGHQVLVTHEGYEPWSDTITLGPRSKRISVRMAPATPHEITGPVTDEWGRTVDHGTVRITGVDGTGDVLVGPRLVHLNKTGGEIDADRLPPLPYDEHRYRVNVTATGYEANATMVEADVGGSSTYPTPFVLEQRNTTTVVTDRAPLYRSGSNGSMPVVESEVILNGTDDVTGDIHLVRTTNETGELTLERLLPGKYRVQFTRYVLYQVRPGHADTESGEVIVRAHVDGPEECRRATQSGQGPTLSPGRPPYYCRPLTAFEEIQRTVTVEVVADGQNSIVANRSTPTGSADLSALAGNGTTGRNRTAVWETRPNTTVNVTVPDTVDMSDADPGIRAASKGFIPNIDGEPYFVTRTPVDDQRWTSDSAGTLDLSLYPAIYGPEAVAADDPADSHLNFSALYLLSERERPVWVSPNRTTDRVLRLYPTWTDVEGRADPYGIPNATVEMEGAGWEPEPGGTVAGLPTLVVPAWLPAGLQRTYGGQNVTLTTDSEGRYAGRVPLDNYSTTVTAAGFDDLETTVSLDTAAPRTAVVNHRLEPSGGNVTKTLESHNIVTLDDGTLDCSGTNEYNVTARPYSERFGQYVSGTNVPAGNYTVYEHREPPKNITVAPGQDVPVRFFKEEKDPNYTPSCAQDDPYPHDGPGPYTNFTLSGTVTATTNGSVVEGATVNLTITYDSASPDMPNDTTDANGRYQIEGVLPADASINSTSLDVRKGTAYIPETDLSASVLPGEETGRDVGLDSAQGEVRVRVEDSENLPIEDARVTVQRGFSPNWNPTGADGWARFAGNDSEHPTVLPVDVGEYDVQVRKPGYYYDGSDVGFAANVSVRVPSDSDVERYERTVQLREIPDPEISDLSMDRGPSDDETGLFLEGVKLPTTATAWVDPPAVDGLEEPPADIRLIANRGPDERGGIVLDSLQPEHERVEAFDNGSYRADFEFDIADLPTGRNNFTVAVRTEHGATNETLLRQAGDPYWIDVLPVPNFLSSLLSAARVPDALTGITETSNLSLSDSVERESENYNWTPEGAITAEYGDYVSYGVEIGVGVEMAQDNPVDSTDDAAESFGFAEQSMPSLSIEYDGENRSFSMRGGISFDGSADSVANVKNPLFDDVTMNSTWSAGFSTGGETTWGEPVPRGGDFTETFRSTDNVSGSFGADFKATIRNEYIVSALGAPPVVGTWLNRLDTNLYVTARFGTSINWLLVYDGAGGLLGYAILPEGEEPAGLDPDESGLDLGVDLGVGAGAQVYGHEAVEGNILPSFTFEFNPLAGSPGFERITGQVDATLKLSLSSWGPSKDWKWDLAGPGTLWESEAANGADGTAAPVFSGPGARLFATDGGIAQETTAAVTPISTAYGTPADDRYWLGGNYSQFNPAPADSADTLVANAYPGAEPSVAALSGEAAQVVYARDDGTAPRLSTELRSTTADRPAGTWRQPGAVPDTDAVASPVTASLGGGRTVTVWRSMAPLDGETNPLLAMNETELRYSVFDGEGWREAGPLTDNAALERDPAVAADRGQFLSVWTGIRSGYLLDDTGVDVRYARVDATGDDQAAPDAGDSGTIVADVALAGSPAVGFADGRGLVVYSVHADGDAETDGDVRLAASVYSDGTWGSPEFLAGPGDVSHPMALVTDESMEIAWVSNGSEVMRAVRSGDAWSDPTTALDQDGIRAIDLVGRADARALVWQGFGPTARSLYYATANGSSDGFGEARLLDGRAEYASHSATIDATADRLLVTAVAEANSTESLEGAPDLRVFSRPITGGGGARDIRLSGLSVNGTDVAIGEAVGVTATVHNDGTEPATVALDFAIDGSTEVTRNVTIRAGGAEDVSFVTSFATAGTYEVTIDGEPAGTITVTESDQDTGQADGDEPSGDGGSGLVFPVLALALLAIAAAGGYYWYSRRQADSEAGEPADEGDSTDGGSADTTAQSTENDDTGPPSDGGSSDADS